MRILMSAYACEPGQGSEPRVGWNWAVQVARHHDVWVLTRASNRPAIEAELRERPVPRLRIIYHDLPGCSGFWRHGEASERVYYLLWQLTALPRVSVLHRQVRFDIVHHTTFNTVDSPGYIWLLGVPFIWGPVGGAQIPPAALKHYFGRRWILERIREARKRLVQASPIIRLAVRRSAHVLAANADTEHALRGMGARNVTREIDAAVTIGAHELPARRMHDAFTVLWAGQLIARKAPMLALDVAAELVRRGLDFRMMFVGDGPLQDRLTAAVAARGLQDQVSIVGAVLPGDIDRYYRQSDAFLFTSLCDTSGNVVLEAMAQGLPVVTLDHQGAAEMVSSATGIKVPVRTAREVIDNLADALESLASDPELVDCLGAAGFRRVRERFTWDRKAEVILPLYDAAARPCADCRGDNVQVFSAPGSSR